MEYYSILSYYNIVYHEELAQPGPALLLRMLHALRDNPTRGYPGRQDYGHIRICRLFMYALRINATVDGKY